MGHKGNMYNFVETWNPLGGECSHKCSYCYRKDMMRFPVNKEKYSGKPRLVSGKSGMDKNLGNGNFWFVGSMTDIFAEDVPREMILRILQKCDISSQNKYLFQSKNPERFIEFLPYFPDNTTLCCTLETSFQRHLKNFSGGSNYSNRYTALKKIKHYGKFPIHITIEPIMKFGFCFITDLIKLNPQQINIGADSSKEKLLPEPSKGKILELIEKLEEFTTVFQKDNLKRLLK